MYCITLGPQATVKAAHVYALPSSAQTNQANLMSTSGMQAAAHWAMHHAYAYSVTLACMMIMHAVLITGACNLISYPAKLHVTALLQQDSKSFEAEFRCTG